MDRVCTALLFVALVAAAGGGVEASVHVYTGDTFREVGNAYLLAGGSEGIVGSRVGSSGGQDVPEGVRDGRAFIRFEHITFWRSKEASSRYSPMEHSTGLVQAILLEAGDRNNIGGSAYGGQKSICCTPDLAKIESCRPGEVLRKPSSVDPAWPYVIDTFFSANYASAEMDGRSVNVTRTGMYNLFFITCDPRLRGLKMTGRTMWKNPTGYLPGRMAPLLTFYMFMLLAYVLLSLIWAAQCVRFWKDVLQIQNYISIVVVLGFLEMSLWYFEYSNFNSTGERPVGITLCAVTVGALRKTISRLLILTVSMGYGVVRPTLGGLTSKVILLGVTYFLATEALDIVENVGRVDDISGKARLLLVLPAAFLDAFLILWIFTSLSRTLEKLQARRSSAKLDIYRKFTNALAVSIIASVAWIGYEVYFKATDVFSERWRSAWIITAFWDILAFTLLCVICYLWGPSQNSRRYSYSDELGEDLENEEAQPLTRRPPEPEIAMVKQETREDNSSDVFTLDDEPEEDKRE